MWVALNDEFDAARRSIATKATVRPVIPPRSSQAVAMTEEQLAFEQEQEAFGNADLARIDNEREERDGLRRQLERKLSDPAAMLNPEQMALRDILRDLAFDASVERERLVMANLGARDAVRMTGRSADAGKGGSSISLYDVAKRWAAERKPIPRTVRRADEIIGRFEAVVGKMPLAAITKQHVLDFKDQLLAEGSSPANINVMLTLLGVILNFATKNNLIPINPASAIRVQDRRLAKAKRVFFDEAALKAIFSSPIYTEGARPIAGGGDAAYWLPLLALYTGARLEELGQLHPDDVRQEGYRDGDDERSAWVIRITDNPERGQRLKNEGSKRRVPIHADLIALGFLEVAQAALAAGWTRIFHDLKPASDGKETGNFSKWFGRYRRSTLGLKGRDTPFHSFRHSFKYYAQYSDIPDAPLRAIMGHETGDTADDYDAMFYPMPPLVAAIGRYKVPGFTLPARP
jgi:integrase